MTAARVLALDLSIAATGVAYPHGQLGTIRTDAKTGTTDQRLILIRDSIRAALNIAAPRLVAVEGFVVRSQSASVLGMLHGIVRGDLYDRGIPYFTVPPATLKVYATGKGLAQKPDMRMALYKRTDQDIADDNQVDAAWLRLLALDLAGAPEVDLPQSHRRALDKVSLPAVANAIAPDHTLTVEAP